MDRINSADATNTRMFTAGGAGGAPPATTVTADWLNGVQEELIGLIAAGTLTPDATKTDQVKRAIVNLLHPVGVELTFGVDYDPNQVWPWQTWTEITDGRVVVPRDNSQTEFNTTGKTGGEKAHALTNAELPVTNLIVPSGGGGRGASNVTYDANAALAGRDAQQLSFGGGQAHNNLQPYRVARIWRRTA